MKVSKFLDSLEIPNSHYPMPQGYNISKPARILFKGASFFEGCMQQSRGHAGMNSMR